MITVDILSVIGHNRGVQIVKLARRGNSRMISIPPAYLTQLGWRDGDAIALEIAEGELVAFSLRPMLREALRRGARRVEEAHAETAG